MEIITVENTRINPGPVTHTGPHMWDSWYPYNENSHHRACLFPGCGVSQIKRPEKKVKK